MNRSEDEIPRHVLKKIDKAFDDAVKQASQAESLGFIAPPTVRRKRGDGILPKPNKSHAEDTGGGFLVPSPPASGGFIVDDDVEMESTDDVQIRLPLSFVPTALQQLDLPPADDEIMSVFKNAAMSGVGKYTEDTVSREDWRAVCSVLLDERSRQSLQPSEEENISVNEGDSSDDEEYMENAEVEEISSDEADLDEEYNAKPKVTSNPKRKGKRKRSRSSNSSDSEVPARITKRQRAECRKAFALFFPEVEDGQLDSQKIMIKDVAHAASLLKVKMTAEEIIEMLAAFSTSPDKSMNLSDFERMMMVAKLA